ncbi:CocE/NonD family hydrolase [Homoserinimonas sp. OAct 916]|uniref:CocE/NonD family hydrolase n=1 Tax=Homoserinimonas sp. OAct 916 TaxID=2211450 RepID=UPI0018E58C9E|nr:CocE/NonD family hydrolase [Homoserinimonas sp. OAct 916]
MDASLDVPWRRPGRITYARARLAAFIRPPVAVTPAPADLQVHRDVAVPMKDGVLLRVNVYRPPGDEPVPVILSAHPYGKGNHPHRTRRGWSLNFQYRIMNQPAPVEFSSETGWEAPDPVWWVSQGYAVINADLRGAGTSEGVGSLLSDAEAADVVDLIEWAGAQPWSTGSVGMLGVSYLAISQYKAAALHPPSLKAICPWEGFTDAYRDFMTPGGVTENGFARIWLFMSMRVARLRVNLGRERKAHPLHDAWWDALTPDLAAITVPMLVCTSFSDDNVHSSGSMRAFQRVGSTDRFAYAHRGPKWSTFYGEPARTAQLQFFDRYLKQKDVPTLPPLRLEVRESAHEIVAVRAEQEWPLARTVWTDLYLADEGVLRPSPGDEGRIRFELRRTAAAFTWTVGENVELTGPLALKVWLSLERVDDANIFVGVEKRRAGRAVDFEGSYGYGRDCVASGRLRVALRELDEDLSTPQQPEHTFRTAQPLAHGEIVPLEIPLTGSSTLFRAGDELRVLVAGRYLQPRNPLFGHFPAHYVPSEPGYGIVHFGGEHPSRLLVPVVPAATQEI